MTKFLRQQSWTLFGVERCRLCSFCHSFGAEFYEALIFWKIKGFAEAVLSAMSTYMGRGTLR